MILEIDLSAETPLYQQIRDQIVLGITRGDFQSGEQLPPVRQLASDLVIKFMTVSKAYNLLKQEGWIVTERGRGSRVVLPEAEQALPDAAYWQKLSLLLAEGLAQSRDPEAFAEKAGACLQHLMKERP